MATNRYIKDKQGKLQGSYPSKPKPPQMPSSVAMLQFIEPAPAKNAPASYDDVYTSFAAQTAEKERRDLIARFMSSGMNSTQAEVEANQWIAANEKYENRVYALELQGFTRSDAQGAIYAEDHPSIISATKDLTAGKATSQGDKILSVRPSSPEERRKVTQAFFYTSPTDVVCRSSTSTLVRTDKRVVGVLQDGQIIASVTAETEDDAIALYEATCSRLPE